MKRAFSLSLTISPDAYRALLQRASCVEDVQPPEAVAAAILEDALRATPSPQPDDAPDPFVEIVAGLEAELSEVTIAEVAARAGIPSHRQTRALSQRIAAALHAAGWDVGGQRGTGRRERFYVRAEPSSASPATYPTTPRHGAAPPLPAMPGDAAPGDVAAALRDALWRLTEGRNVTRIAAQNVVDEAGAVGDAAWREAARLLRDSGWRQGPGPYPEHVEPLGREVTARILWQRPI